MRFTIGEDRAEFAAAVRKALADGCDPSVVRAAWDGDLDHSIWSTLVEMGTTDPGLDWVTRVAVAEEIGRAALPHPWVETAFVAAPLLGADLGSQLASTDLGTRPLVPAGAVVDVLLLATERSGVEVVAPSDVILEPVETVDRSRRMVSVSSWSGGRAVDLDGHDPFVAGALGTAAVLVGLGQHLLDTTVSYVSERHQFGQPVGGFQAVKHHLADAAKDLAFARPMVHRAAHGLDVGASTASRDVSAAKTLASDAASLTADVALQCHGAIGYTVEYDLHLWLKRVWALSRSWGDSAHHRAVVADAIGLR